MTRLARIALACLAVTLFFVFRNVVLIHVLSEYDLREQDIYSFQFVWRSYMAAALTAAAMWAGVGLIAAVRWIWKGSE